MPIDDAVQNGRWLWLRRSELRLMLRALEAASALELNTSDEELRAVTITTLTTELEKLR